MTVGQLLDELQEIIEEGGVDWPIFFGAAYMLWDEETQTAKAQNTDSLESVDQIAGMAHLKQVWLTNWPGER